MAVSTSRLAFSDCYELLEKAVQDSKGIRVKFASYEDAFNFRLRLHQARRIDRIDNAATYAEGHTLCGRSVYDQLSCKIRKFDGGAWLRIERIDARVFEVESLSEAPIETELPFEPPTPPPPSVFVEKGKDEIHLVMPIRLRRRV